MLSRRQFLLAAGIAAAAAHLPQIALAFDSTPAFDPTYLYGRALQTLAISAAPSAAAPVIARLWSDSVRPILDVSGAWYRLPEGYAAREQLQPMIAAARRSGSPAAPPFWGEVSGALAVLRAFCAADAPIIARIGHGGVLRVIDYLPGDGIDWYGVAESEGGDLLGWTQAADWSPARVDQAAPTLTLSIDPAAQQMTVSDGDQAVLRAPISTGRGLPPGSYPIRERSVTQPTLGAPGASWVLGFGGDLQLAGVYWHNRFGAPTPGAAVQVTPPLARWLYARAARVIVS